MPPAWGAHRPPFLCATSMALSSALLKRWVVDLVLKGGEGEDVKEKGGRPTAGERGFSAEQRPACCQGWAGWAPCAEAGSGAEGAGSRVVAGREVERKQTLPVEPGPSWQSCRPGIGPASPSPPPQTLRWKGLRFLFYNSPHPFQTSSLRKKLCVVQPSGALRDGCLQRGKILQ